MSGDTAARAVLRELQGRCSPEADAAIGAFERREKQIRETLLASYSGRELIEAGYTTDVNASLPHDET